MVNGKKDSMHICFSAKDSKAKNKKTKVKVLFDVDLKNRIKNIYVN